jgi:hypothetical protein
MSDYQSALWMPVPLDYVFIDRWGYTANYLILHKTGGGSTAQSTAAWFQSGSDGAHVSVHYIVGLDGQIVQCVEEKDGAGGNGILEPGHAPFWNESINPNLITTSIECVDPTLDNSTPMPQAQKSALFPLVKDICTRQSIPMRAADASGGIAGHNSISPQSRAHCPGTFPWDELWAFLKGSSTMEVPAGWTDNGTTLKAPNGFVVVLGFRDYVLAHSWDAHNLPCENEAHCDQLEYSNPGLGGGSKQRFYTKTLEWTQDRGVFEAYTGPELIKQDQIIQQQAAQIQQLTTQAK